MMPSRLTVAWISDFGIEWLPDLPLFLQASPRAHPMTWQQVLLGEFANKSHLQLHVIALRKQIPQDVSFERQGACFHVLKAPGGLRAPSFFWLDTFLIGRLLKRLKPDLIHAWGLEKGAGLVASRLRYPYVVTIQGLLSWYKEQTTVNAYHRFTGLFERRSLTRAQAVTTESAFAVHYLRQRYPGLRAHQVEHAPNWLFHQIERQPQTKPLRFLCVGTVGHRKGTDLLLRAFDQLVPGYEFELIFVGGRSDDPFLAPLKTSLQAELWNRVTFKTDLPPAQVAKEMSLATILVLPTRADTSPNAVKEAVVGGLPVVASDVGGIPDYVTPNKNGLLFPPGNLEELVRALRAACQHSLFSHGQVESTTLEQTRDYLSPARMERRFFEIYQDLARRADSPAQASSAEVNASAKVRRLSEPIP